MTPPTSAARALHDLLGALEFGIHNKGSVWNSWTEKTELPIPSAEFARYHSEVMSLFQNVAESIDSLDPSQRAKYADYLSRWWSALILPRENWTSGNVKTIIEPHALHLLDALADLLENRAKYEAPQNPQTVEMLARAVAYLLGEVDALTDLPDSVRTQVRLDLQHIAWLLENVDSFGVDHVVGAVERTAGRTVVAAARTPSAWGLKKLAIGLVAALAVVSGSTGSVAQIAADVRSTFGVEAQDDAAGGDVVQKVVMEIHDVCAVPQLTSGPASSGDRPVDAEIVEETNP